MAGASLATPLDIRAEAALVLKNAGRLVEAEAEFRAILAIDPYHHLARTELADQLLSLGRWTEAWPLNRIYDHLTVKPDPPPLPFPEWRGEPLAGKSILIWPRFGMGDQIQFARYVRVLQAKGARVTFVVLPAFGTLFENLGCDLVYLAESIELRRHDYWVYSALIPNRLEERLEALPASIPYLKAPPPPPGLRMPEGEGFKVGIIWSGNPAHANDADRSTTQETFAPLKTLPITLVPLAPEFTGARDIGATAALVERLDLVVSVDTAIVHLAGALGKPAWVMLPAWRTDWRWLRGRDDTPWYPSLRLYRQPTRGDWATPMQRIVQDLRERLTS